MSSNGYRARLERVEAILLAAGGCPWCHDQPRRYVTIDADSGAVLSETMPCDGCPACGQLPLITREYVREGVRDHSREGA